MYHDDIKETYKKRFEELGHEKQFHLATRLALWNGDSWACEQIRLQKVAFLGGTTESDWHAKVHDIQALQPNYQLMNHAEARKAYFEANPGLFGLELGMFQALHAHFHFSVDLTSSLPASASITAQLDMLTTDIRALGTLSTYIVDIFYLYHRFLNDDETVLSLALLQEASRKSPSVQLAVYLLTHCVIGETLFYNREIPTRHLTYYQALVKGLNTLATRNWQELTLDNKLEIALCNQIARVASPLINRAIKDANSHFSSEHGYIIDPKKNDKATLTQSEHRNVLYLMVTR